MQRVSIGEHNIALTKSIRSYIFNVLYYKVAGYLCMQINYIRKYNYIRWMDLISFENDSINNHAAKFYMV